MKIIPAILTDSLETFRRQIKQVESDTDLVQIDISDGQFAPSTTLLADEVKAVATGLKYELHLMVVDPTRAIEEWYVLPNIQTVIFHIETAKFPAAVIEHIKSYGWRAGVALNPETPLEAVEAAAYQADKIVFLSVTPGAQGQVFDEKVLTKIQEFKNKHPQMLIEVDGGIHETELKKLKNLGVEEAVLGSEIFGAADPAVRLRELQKII